MHHFISLNIETPVPGTLFEGDIGLLAVNMPLELLSVSPFSVDNTHPGIIDFCNDLPGPVIIIALADSNDKFITERKNRFNRLCNRIVEFLGIARKGEPANFHQSSSILS